MSSNVTAMRSPVAHEIPDAVHIERFEGAAKDWDRFVKRQPGHTHFHLIGWKSVVEQVFGHECIYLSARDLSGSLCGILPMVRVRSRMFGHYVVSMPFVNYGGPLGTSEAVSALAEDAARLAREDDVKLLELRSRVELPVSLRASHRKVTTVLDIPEGGSKALWDSLNTKLRTKVRRPKKAGVEVQFGLDQVEPFFAVYSEHMRDLGTPTQSLQLFKALAEQFPEDCWCACARLKGRVVAGGLGFRWADEFEVTWASALPEFNRLRPNTLLFWSFMERAADEGCTLFNFGRSTPGAGTHAFKQQWGSRDEQLWWYGLSADEEVTTPSPDSGPYSWGPRIWKKLPASVATAIGPRISRYLP